MKKYTGLIIAISISLIFIALTFYAALSFPSTAKGATAGIPITVPSASSSGFLLSSISQGRYEATSTDPLYIGSLFATSTATSTFNGGINLTSGCFSIQGTCVGKVGDGGLDRAWEIITADNINYLRPTSTITTLHNNGFISQASSTVTGILQADTFNASTSFITQKWVSIQGNLGLDLTDDGSDLVLHADVGGVNRFVLDTDGAFFELFGNPGPANDDLLASITETQGDDTQILFYEGGVGNNRFAVNGSARIGGGANSLCAELTSDVDCDTSGTGADLVVQDDIWLGGAVIATSITDTSYFLGKLGVATNTLPNFELGVQGNALVSGTTTSGTLQATSTVITPQITIGSKPITIFDGTGLTLSGTELQSTLGTSVDLTTEVTGTLPVGNGGTGNTSFTAGSVIFSNGTILTQDNANLFWNDTENRLGIGTLAPQLPLDVNGEAIFRTAAPVAPTGIGSYLAIGYDSVNDRGYFSPLSNTASTKPAFIDGSPIVLTNNVGIASSTPGARLGIQGDIVSDGNLNIGDITATGTVQIKNSTGAIVLDSQSSSGIGILRFATNTAPVAGSLSTFNLKSASSTAEGNLGIGTTTQNQTFTSGGSIGCNSIWTNVAHYTASTTDCMIAVDTSANTVRIHLPPVETMYGTILRVYHVNPAFDYVLDPSQDELIEGVTSLSRDPAGGGALACGDTLTAIKGQWRTLSIDDQC